MGGRSLPRHVRLITLFDMTACALFALPWLSQQVVALISAVNDTMGLPGAPIYLQGSDWFFVNLAGVLGVALNAMLLRSAEGAVHLVNVVARIFVSLIIAYHIMANGLPALFGLFILTEIGGAIATWPWIRQRFQNAG